MLDTIKIENFQSHEDTVLELHPILNVIVGSSDSGKTAIVRAMRWLVFNRPIGDAFRSTWGGGTSVSVVIGGDTVSRIKRGSKNLYCLNGEELLGFGQTVPEDVQKLLQLDSINFQGQLDTSFLLSQHPSEVARFFNGIVGLNIVDAVISISQKRWLACNVQLKQALADVATHTESLTSFATLDETNGLLTSVEIKHAQVLGLESQISTLKSVSDDAMLVQQKLNTLNVGILSVESDVDGMVDILEELRVTVASITSLSQVLLEINQCNEEMQDNTDFYTSADPILKIDLECERIREQIVCVRSELNHIQRHIDTSAACDTNIERLELELSKIPKPKVCPKCGQEIK